MSNRRVIESAVRTYIHDFLNSTFGGRVAEEVVIHQMTKPEGFDATELTDDEVVLSAAVDRLDVGSRMGPRESRVFKGVGRIVVGGYSLNYDHARDLIDSVGVAMSNVTFTHGTSGKLHTRPLSIAAVPIDGPGSYQEVTFNAEMHIGTPTWQLPPADRALIGLPSLGLPTLPLEAIKVTVNGETTFVRSN